MNTLTAFSVADVLDRAMSEIGQRGLCQGDFRSWDGRVCTEGAIRYAIAGRADTLRSEMTDEQGRLLDRVMDQLIQVIRDRDSSYNDVAFGWVTPDWNDEPGRTVDEVLAVLWAARTLAGGAS